MAEESNSSVVSQEKRGQHSLLLRAAWYIFVGWWLTSIWLGTAWFLIVTIIGMPIGFWMINRVPKVLTLKRKQEIITVKEDEDGTSKDVHRPDQHNLFLRGIYFLFVGWWLSFIWMALATAVSFTIIGLPLAIWMYNRIPEVTTLYKHK